MQEVLLNPSAVFRKPSILERDEVQQHVPSAENVDQPILGVEIVRGFVQIFSLSPSFFLEALSLPTRSSEG